jgi:hypothetical protein
MRIVEAKPEVQDVIMGGIENSPVWIICEGMIQDTRVPCTFMSEEYMRASIKLGISKRA